LESDSATRRVTVVGGGNRQERGTAPQESVLAYLRANDGASANALEKALVREGGAHKRAVLIAALDQLVESRQVVIRISARNARQHHLAECGGIQLNGEEHR
jgi:hypothetical protein